MLIGFNKPFQTLSTLLLGLHSANIRTSKGSIYRMRFVAPASTSAAASKSRGIPTITSAAYPLMAALPDLYSDLDPGPFLHRGTEDTLNKEFGKLVRAELDALDDLSSSDCSSTTDTEWAHPFYAGGNVRYMIENNGSEFWPSWTNCAMPHLDPQKWIGEIPTSSSDEEVVSKRIMYLQQDNPGHIMYEMRSLGGKSINY